MSSYKEKNNGVNLGGYKTYRTKTDNTYKPVPTKNIIKCNYGTPNLCNAREFSIDLVDNGELLVNIWNLDGTLMKFNKQAQRKTGYKEEEVLGREWINKILPETDVPGLDNMFQGMKKGETPPVTECQLYCKDGSSLNVIWSNFIMSDVEGRPNLGVSVGVDITELRETNNKLNCSYEEIHRIAYCDEITGLPNKTMFWKTLSTLLNNESDNKQRIALLSMDIDDFKDINDNLGHDNGDKLLRIIAERINKLSSEDISIARWGGDEFVVLIKNVKDTKDITEICHDLIKEFKKPIVINDMNLYITVSIGGAIYPEDGQDEYTLFKSAEIAMYNAKEQIGNRFELFTSDMNLRIREKLQLENGIREALKNDEFSIHYQPQVNIATNKVVGVEALIRWYHPTKGYIPPLRFIPVAEETGLIIEVGELVLRKSCEQFVKWKEVGIDLGRIAVNISAKQFEQSNFVSVVKDIIEETKIDPRQLELEITESIAMKNLDYTIKVINELQKTHIKVSLDDFGTGYSSLNYLMRLPISTLKIDKSFIDNIKMNSNEELIAKTIIALAKNMNLSVVAEGVETDEQLKFLQEQNCDIAQGYLFSRPMPESDIKKIYGSKNY